jgi:outer membrane murein-binding lipoprotein Lpp
MARRKSETMTKILSIGAAVIAALLTAGCTSSPDPDTFGGRLQNSGGAVAAIGKNWSEAETDIIKGRVMVADGEDDVTQGDKLVASGKSQISKGEAMIRTGERLKREAEDAYRLLTVPAGAAAPTS